MIVYLQAGEIAAARRTPVPAYGVDSQGYGRQIPTQYKVKLAHSPAWRRVFVCQISNAGTVYVLVKGEWRALDGDCEDKIKSLLPAQSF